MKTIEKKSDLKKVTITFSVLVAVLLITSIAFVSDFQTAEAKKPHRTVFYSIMSPDQQPPYDPDDPNNLWNQSPAIAYGKFVLKKQGDEIRYRIFASDIENVVGIHIHNGPTGVHAHDHLVDLYPTDLENPIEPKKRGLLLKGTITDEDVLSDHHGNERDLEDLLNAINDYHAYVNLHTNEPGTTTDTNSGPGDLYAPGEARGQIYPIPFKW